MAGVTTATLFEQHSDRIEEVINKNLEVILPSLDPVWRDTIVTSQGVGPADAIGRDMKILKVFQGAMAGVLEQAAPRGDLPLYGDDYDGFGAKLYKQDITQTFPDATEGPNAAPYRLGIPMRAMMFNIMFTLGELVAEALPATIGQIVAPKLEGAARNIAHTCCNYTYLDPENYFKLSGIGQTADSEWSVAGPTSAAAGDDYFTITFQPDNLATDRYYVGQRVDVYDSTGATRKNEASSARVDVFVSAVDELKNQVSLVTKYDPEADTTSDEGSGDWDTALADDDVVVYANSKATTSPNFSGVSGFHGWIKDGSGSNNNFLLGGDRITGDAIDVTVHPEHKSFSKSVGAVLTEHKLRQYLRRFHAAKNKYGYYIDCLIASDGVWLGYEGTKIGRELIDRTGRLSSLRKEGTDNGEYDGFQFTFDGRTYTGYTSSYVENGTMWGIRKGGNNWKRYVPPDPMGLRNFDRVEPFIPFRFVASALTGLGTNQLPIYSISNSRNLVTEASQMPGWLRMQLVPDQPCGMKLTGITEDRIYSDN